MRSALLFIQLFTTSIFWKGTGGSAFAQDPHFTQFNYTPLYTNPAHAGMSNDMQLICNYKNQWRSIIKPYEGINVSFLYPLLLGSSAPKRPAAVGVSIINDRAGEGAYLRTAGTNLSFSYNLELSQDHFLSAGIHLGYYQKSIDISGLMTGSQYINGQYIPTASPGENFAGDKVNFFDAGTGLLWYMEKEDKVKASSGIALYHITRPDQSFYNQKSRLPFKVVYTGSVYAAKFSNIDVIPSVLAMYQEKAQELMIGSSINYNFQDDAVLGHIGAGVWYRNKDAVAIAIEVAQNNFLLSFSYDINISQLLEATDGKGSPEVAFVIKRPAPRLKQPVKSNSHVKSKRETPVSIPPKTAILSTDVWLKGLLTDSISGKATEGRVVIKDVKRDVVIYDSYVSGVGNFKSKLKSGRKYAITITKNGYNPYGETLDVPAAATGDILREIRLSKTEKQEKIEKDLTAFGEAVEFDPGKAQLTPASFQLLDNVVQLLSDNSEIKLSVEAHTDSIGSQEANIILSQKRADAVITYLVKKGIDASRLKAMGYGEARPRSSNNTEGGRRKNRRVEFNITEP